VFAMGAGVFLLVLGAILAFAVDDEVPGINLAMTGLILMLAGAAVIAYKRRGVERERVVTRIDDPAEPGEGQHVVKEIVREHETDHYQS
jgi:membrane protein implicated in regulation of membrane protease activity